LDSLLLAFHLSQKRAKKEENPYGGLEDDDDEDDDKEEDEEGVMQYVVGGVTLWKLHCWGRHALNCPVAEGWHLRLRVSGPWLSHNLR
jgi:hypothetical protein